MVGQSTAVEVGAADTLTDSVSTIGETNGLRSVSLITVLSLSTSEASVVVQLLGAVVAETLSGKKKFKERMGRTGIQKKVTSHKMI